MVMTLRSMSRSSPTRSLASGLDHAVDLGEEVLEQLERELLHVVHEADRDEQKLEHGALVGDGYVDLMEFLNEILGVLGLDLGTYDHLGVLLGLSSLTTSSSESRMVSGLTRLSESSRSSTK